MHDIIATIHRSNRQMTTVVESCLSKSEYVCLFHCSCWRVPWNTPSGWFGYKAEFQCWRWQTVCKAVCPAGHLWPEENAFHKKLRRLNFGIALKLSPHPFGLTCLWGLFPFPHLDRLRHCPRAFISKEKFLFHPTRDFSLLWALVSVKHGCRSFGLILCLGM